MLRIYARTARPGVRRQRLAMVIFVLAVGAVVVPSGGAAPHWGPSVVIAPPGGVGSEFDHPYNPDIDVNERGDVSVIWNTLEGQFGADGTPQLKERTLALGVGSWSAPVNIAQTHEPGYVHVDAAGNATVVYWGGYIRAADRSASEAQWLSQITLSPLPYGSVWQMSVDMNDRGDTVAAWTRSAGSGNVLDAAVRLDGVWSAPVVLPAREPTVFFTAAAIDPAGNTLVLWNDNGKVKSAFRPTQSGVWQSAEIGTAGPYDQVSVGFDAGGNATAEWQSGTAFRPFGGTWSQAVLVRPANWDQFHDLAVCGNGDAVVLYTGSPAVIGSVRTKAWKLTELHSRVEYANTVLAAVRCDQNGNAVAVWSELDGIWSSIRPAGGAWQPASEVVAQHPESLSLGLDGKGNATAVWEADTYPPLRSTISVSELTPGGPILQELKVPRTRANVLASFSVRALPWGAPIQEVGWDFGDGTSSRGVRVKHRYRRAGKYNVTVTARDANGSATFKATVRVDRRPKARPTG